MKNMTLYSKIYPPIEEKRRAFARHTEKYRTSACSFLLGKSILGKEIDLYRLGEGDINVLYLAAHHGSEYITASTLYFLIYKLSVGENKRSDRIKKLLSSFSIWIVPVVNPDGVDMSAIGLSPSPLYERQLKMSAGEGFCKWQANARGVDLNHNYNAGFYEYKRIEIERGIEPGRSLYSGEFPESEPESAAVMRLLRLVSFSLVVSLHSQGEEIYSFPENPKTEKIAKRAASLSGYTLSKPTGTAAFGGLCDCTGGVMNISSLTVELGRGENPLEENQLPKLCKTVYKTLTELPFLLL